MAIKTYVLLESMDSDAPVFQQTVDGKRIQVKKIPVHRPTLRQTFQDENGVGKTIRYKESSTSVDQLYQMEKEKIDANERFTTTERNDLRFKFGTLTTDKLIAQTYLEAHPEFSGFKGRCDDVKQPRYRLLDTEKDEDLKNEDMRKRVKAATKVLSLSLEDAQEMLIRLNGSFFKTPDKVGACQNLLMQFVDDANDAGLDDVLKGSEEITVDDKTTVLIGTLINSGVISFDQVQGKISKKGKDGKWITLRDMSAEYTLDERKRLFSDFLNTDDGSDLKADLEKELKKTAKAVDKKPE